MSKLGLVLVKIIRPSLAHIKFLAPLPGTLWQLRLLASIDLTDISVLFVFCILSRRV